MSFQTYLIESVQQMDALLLQSDLDKEPDQTLLKAAAIGCRTLGKLCEDPELPRTFEQAADVRVIARFMEKASEREQRASRERVQEFRNIIENPDRFKEFLELERELLIKGNVPFHVVDLLIEASYRALDEIKVRAKPPDEIMSTVLLLRDRACLLFNDMKTSAVDLRRWGRLREKIKLTVVGIGGIGLVGLNASALALSIGITTVGSTVSGAIGGGIISGVAGELLKTREAGN
jgi:hypothetical protein